jgi:hypothetical protein
VAQPPWSIGAPEPHSGTAATQDAIAEQDTEPTVCTSVCTDEPRTQGNAALVPLAAALLGLSAADRARLAAMLLGQQPDGQAGAKTR